jgi:hypothetical protein
LGEKPPPPPKPRAAIAAQDVAEQVVEVDLGTFAAAHAAGPAASD